MDNAHMKQIALAHAQMLNDARLFGVAALSIEPVPPSRIFRGYLRTDPFSNRAGMASLAQHIEQASGKPL